MTTKNISLSKLLPVFLSFVVMGFIDIIGVATGYIKQDFKLTDFIAQFLPMMVLLWFFVLSVSIKSFCVFVYTSAEFAFNPIDVLSVDILLVNVVESAFNDIAVLRVL